MSVASSNETRMWKQVMYRLSDALTESLSYLLFRNRFALFAKLILPLLVMVVLFILPLWNVLLMSFWQVRELSLVRTFTFRNYTYFVTEPAYIRAIWRTIRLGFVVTLACLALGYPMALILTRVRMKYRSVVVFILVAPLFVTVVIRVFGWLVLLEREGLINYVLLRLGIINQPIMMIYNERGVTISLINVLLVFMVIPIISALAGIPRSLSEAAQTLGANRLSAWWHVVWPLSTPGVVSGVVLVFAITVSSYTSPRILGGDAFLVIPLQVYREVCEVLNWPLGAAMGFVILIITSVATILTYAAQMFFFPHTRRGVRDKGDK